MSLTIFGIPNCDTVKKARRWLDEAGIDYRFHDFRKNGLDAALLAEWVETLGWEALLNRRGMTWRKLADDDKAELNADKAQALMLDYPTLIKRPVWQAGAAVAVGFDDMVAEWVNAHAA